MPGSRPGQFGIGSRSVPQLYGPNRFKGEPNNRKYGSHAVWGRKVPFVTGRQEARDLPWLGALDGGEGVGRIQPWPATAACLQLRRHNRTTKPQKLDLHFCSAPYANSSGHFVTISWTRAPGIACTRAFLGPFARRRSGVSSRPDVDVPTFAREPRPGLGHPSCTRLAPSRVRRSPCLTPHWLIDGFA